MIFSHNLMVKKSFSTTKIVQRDLKKNEGMKMEAERTKWNNASKY